MKITVKVHVGRYEDTFSEDQFPIVSKIRSSSDPVAACEKAIRSAKQSYARFSGSPKNGLWHIGKISVLEAVMKEVVS